MTRGTVLDNLGSTVWWRCFLRVWLLGFVFGHLHAHASENRSMNLIAVEEGFLLRIC
jgi:hypothetical protein